MTPLTAQTDLNRSVFHVEKSANLSGLINIHVYFISVSKKRRGVVGEREQEQGESYRGGRKGAKKRCVFKLRWNVISLKNTMIAWYS